MPTKRTRRSPRRRTGNYSHDHVLCLYFGRDFFRAFGDESRPLEAMRKAWPVLREKVFQLAHERRKQNPHSRIMPAGWWLFESSEERDKSITEAEQLSRLGIPYFNSSLTQEKETGS